MADEVVYRLIAGEGIQLLENSSTRTVEVSVPSLDQKINVGDIGLASEATAGIVEIANAAEMIDLADPSRAITPAGLAGIVQSSASDATVGRLLRVGAFGVGSNSLQTSLITTNLDALTTGGEYAFGPSAIGSPLPAAYGVVRHTPYSPANPVQAARIADGTPGSQAREFMRNKTNSGWSAWREIYHTGNFDPNNKANTSGSYPGMDVGNSATVGGQQAVELSPPGQVSFFANVIAPPGWLKANGAAISRTTYARLFSYIGTSWGAGNGSTTFNLPDLRGEFLRSFDDGRGVDPGRGLFTIQSSQNLSHTHTVVGGIGAFFTKLLGGGAELLSGSSNPNVGAAAFTDASGGSEARPRNIALLACIKY